jgi:hypothetical protein
MVPTKRLIRNIYITAIGVVALLGLIHGFWISHAPLLTILIVELIGIGAATVGALIGWLVLRMIYPHLRSEGEKPVMDKKVQANTVKEMNIEYELNIDDILAFHLYHHEHSPEIGRVWKLIRRMLLFISILEFLIAITLLVAFGKQQLPLVIALGACAVLTFLLWSFHLFTFQKTLRLTVARDYGQGRNKLIGKHKLSITPDAVTDITDTGESTTRWNTIGYVSSTDQYLFMLVRFSSPYIVPRSAFDDEAAFRQFVEGAKAYHQAAMA